MIEKLTVNGFKGIPFLESSSLMQHCKGSLRFSKTKPNVIVGPNGSGKSALMQSLALRHLAYFMGHSALDDKYVVGHDSDAFWTNASRWGHDWTFLQGFDCKGDGAPVLYYRPGHIPGNERDYTHAMMVGYFEEAKAQARLVEGKSSGQQSQALLKGLLSALSGDGLPVAYDAVNWRFGRQARELSRQQWTGAYEHQAEVLKKLFLTESTGTPALLMDEPEQSLDARAEMQLWNALAQADCSRMQVIVATHSVYPLLHPKKFNIIEAEGGYAAQVLELLGQGS